ncbi:hypothetical protein ACIPYQ_22370 [Streptomyces sp. NPDC090045]|uniref:hypothetical protein n=1 Tax=Streptomyces sp. NPDC090045 TaxID=3365927 RepID=UPI00381B9199
MDAELTALAEAGAGAVVTAMTTDLWQSTRDAVLGLFHRTDRGRRAEIEAQLDGNAALMRNAEVPEDVRRTLSHLWALELTELLRRDPSNVEPLARLADAVAAALPGSRRAPHCEQTNNARDSATLFAVQRGDLHVHRPGRDAPPD